MPHMVRSKKCLELQLSSTTNRPLLISNAAVLSNHRRRHGKTFPKTIYRANSIEW